MTESLTTLLLRLSEAGPPAVLPGSLAKAYFGSAFDSLLHERLITEKAPSVDWPTCRACECGLDARPLRRVDGRLFAACPLDASEETELDEDDIRIFEIHLRGIVERIASETGTDAPEEIADGVWFLGNTPPGRALFVAPSLCTANERLLIPVLRARARGTPVTIAGDKRSSIDRRFVDAEIHCVPIKDALSQPSTLSFALDVARLVPTTHAVPRLVLHKPARMVTLDGKMIRLSPRSFDLLWLLADAATSDRRVVTRSEIEKRLWNTVVAKGAAADAVRDLNEQLRRVLRANSRSEHLILNRATQGYQLDLPQAAIAMIP